MSGQHSVRVYLYLLIVLHTAILNSQLGAQERYLELVKDSNTTQTMSSNPTSGLVHDGELYFAAYDVATGTELWKTDGTDAGTSIVLDIYDGTGSSYPHELVVFDDDVYFVATDPDNGAELWKTDGTEAGTELVFDIEDGATGSEPTELTVVGTDLFFAATTTDEGTELWKSDGTSNGTELVLDIISGSTGSDPHELTELSGLLFFVAEDSSDGIELFSSTGTALGTAIEADIYSGSRSSSPEQLTVADGHLFFTADDGSDGRELWVYEVIPKSASQVADLRSGSEGCNAQGLTAFDDEVYFSADEGGGKGVELYRTDGVSTIDQVKNIGDAESSFPALFTPSGGWLFFVATTEDEGRELWKTDGASVTTTLVADLTSGSESTPITALVAYRSQVYFDAHTADGSELYRSDVGFGDDDIVQVKDIHPGTGIDPGSSSPAEFVEFDGDLYFAADTPDHGREWWKTDGTELGTELVVDVNTVNEAGAFPPLKVAAGKLHFRGFDDTLGDELVQSDGTEEGTAVLVDIEPDEDGSFPGSFLVTTDGLYFTAYTDSEGTELWFSDGTEVGTVLVKDIESGGDSSDPSLLAQIDGEVYFFATTSAQGRELWTTDGTEVGTTLVENFRPGSASSIELGTEAIVFDGELYFAASTEDDGSELCSSDGTDVSLVADIETGEEDGSHPSDFAVLGGELLFAATTDDDGRELWKWDGVTASQVADIQSGSSSSNPQELIPYLGKVYLSADDGTNGRELWESDGTEAGTVLLKDIESGAEGSDPAEFVLSGKTLYFVASTSTSGRELWQTEATELSTLLVKDIRPGSEGSDPTDLYRFDSKLFFSANDGDNGSELWESNGTEEGTQLVVDHLLGPGGAAPRSLIAYEDELYCIANSLTTAGELHRLVEEDFTDLVVTTVSTPAGTHDAGTPLTVTFTVRNRGNFSTELTSWRDTVFLSTESDLTWDGTATGDDSYCPDPFAEVTLLRPAYLAGGESYERTAQLEIPEGLAGDYYVYVITDRDGCDDTGVITESDETNNLTRSGVFSIAPLTQADLEVVDVIASLASVTAGESIEVEWTVENTGDAPTYVSSWTDRVSLEDAVLGSFSNASSAEDCTGGMPSPEVVLAPGDCYTLIKTVTVPIFFLPGPEDITVWTDFSNGVSESDELNNLSTVSITVLGPPLPDFEPTDASVTAGVIAPGQTITVEWTVDNLGGSPTVPTSWRDRLRLEGTCHGEDIGDFLFTTPVDTSGDPLALTEYTRVVDIQVPEDWPLEEDFVLDIFVDIDYEIDEDSEANNSFVGKTVNDVLNSGADLFAESLSAEVTANGLEFSWTVTNEGDLATLESAWTDFLWLTPGDDLPSIDLGTLRHEGALGAGGSYDASLTFSPEELTNLLEGVLIGEEAAFAMRTDRLDEVLELNVFTNFVALGIDEDFLDGFPDPLEPDLTIEIDSITGDLEPGGTIVVEWTVTNIGDGEATGGWSDAVYLIEEGYSQDQFWEFLGSVTHNGIVGTVVPDNSYTTSATVVLPPYLIPEDDELQIRVRTDAFEQLMDEEGNNSDEFDLALSFPAMANLVVDSVEALESEVVSGQDMTIQWSISNPTGGDLPPSWVDAVYLTKDSRAETELVPLGTVATTAPGLQEASLTVPISLEGEYYVVVVIDVLDQIYEEFAPDDNTLVSDDPVTVLLPNEADLELQDLSVETPATPGLPFTKITWITKNNGPATVQGRWQNALYLSDDDEWDVTDTYIGNFFTEPLGVLPTLTPDATVLTEVLDAIVPGVMPGDYYAILRSDVRDQIPEVDENNNTFVAASTVSVEYTELELDGPIVTGSMVKGECRFYSMEISSAQAESTASIVFSHDDSDAWTELLVSLESVPTTGQSGFRAVVAGSPDQKLIIPTTETGTYFVLAKTFYATTGTGASTGFSIQAETQPLKIESASPDVFGNDGEVSVNVKGSGFHNVDRVELREVAGTGDPIVAVETDVLSGIEIETRFELPAITTGEYELAVVLTDNEEAAYLVNVDGVIPPTLRFYTENGFRLGVPGQVVTRVQNIGNVDAPFVVINHRIQKPSDRSIFPIESRTKGRLQWQANYAVLFDIGLYESLRAGQEVELITGVILEDEVIPDAGQEPKVRSFHGVAVFDRSTFESLNCELSSEVRTVLEDHVEWLPEQFSCSDSDSALYAVQNPDCFREFWFDLLAPCSLSEPDCQSVRALSSIRVPQRDECLPFPDDMSECFEAVVGRQSGVGFDGGSGIPDEIMLALDCVVHQYWIREQCERTVVLGAFDPNEKSGSGGFGVQGFVPGSTDLSYTVQFQNEGNASVQNAEIQDQLQHPLDPETVKFDSVEWGENYKLDLNGGFDYEEDVIMTVEDFQFLVRVKAVVDVERGTIVWSFASPELDVFQDIGFLDNLDQDNQSDSFLDLKSIGKLVFSAQASTSGGTGDPIFNSATIIFDTSPPEQTNQFQNTLDNTEPLSKLGFDDILDAIDADEVGVGIAGTVTSVDVPLEWGPPPAGQPDPEDGGSGIANYTIALSTDDGPSIPFLVQTEDTTTTVSIEPGVVHYYSCVAEDNVGNLELEAQELCVFVQVPEFVEAPEDAIVTEESGTAVLQAIVTIPEPDDEVDEGCLYEFEYRWVQIFEEEIETVDGPAPVVSGETIGLTIENVVRTEEPYQLIVSSPYLKIASAEVSVLYQLTNFIRGDCNTSGGFDVADPIRLLEALFSPDAEPLACVDACDVNNDGSISITDAVFGLNALFLDADLPDAPYPDCGTDQSLDTLSCSENDGSCP